MIAGSTANAARTGDLIVSGLQLLSSRQLLTGELPAWTRTEYGGEPCCSSPLLCSFAHDALSYLDPSSASLIPRVLDWIPVTKRRWYSAAVMTLRWRLRTFIAWQQESDATWRRYGRDSGEPSDAMSTSCAAAGLLVRQGSSYQRHLRALSQFRDTEGLYRTHVASASPPGITVNAHVLRFLTLAGVCGSTQISFLRDAFDERASIFEAHAIARAWRQGGIAGSRELLDRVAHVALAHGFPIGSTLRSSLAAIALLDSGYSGRELTEAAESIADGISVQHSETCESYPGTEAHSVDVGVALALCAIARIAGIRGAFPL